MPTFETPEPILAIIELGYAYVRINASDRTDTVVEVRPGNPDKDGDVQLAEQTQVEYSAGRLWVKSPKQPWTRSLFGPGRSIDVTIDLPTGSQIDANAMAGFRCEGHLGEVKIKTSYGDVRLDEADRLEATTSYGSITVTRAGGPAEITTSYGDIRVGDVDGSAVVKTSNGSITVGEVTGDVSLKTAHGSVSVDRALAGVDAKSAYGDVRIGEVVRGSVDVQTGYGGMEVGIAEGTTAWLDANSKHGRVDSSLADSDGPRETDEVVEIRARNNYGDIRIRRS